jgi:hypothetical protein
MAHMETQSIPSELTTELGGETPDFVVKAKHRVPGKTALGSIVFSVLWLSITGIVGAAFIGPILLGHEVHFTANGVPAVAGPGNLGPLALPILVIVLFTLIGVAVLGNGIFQLWAAGGWFAGTANRLIIMQRDSTRSIDWEDFNGDITAAGSLANRSITLLMRTGRMVSQKDGPDVPDVVYMAGFDDVERVEEIIRKRIKENDPKPTAAPSGPK